MKKLASYFRNGFKKSKQLILSLLYKTETDQMRNNFEDIDAAVARHQAEVCMQK